jgi:hypothetical protein
MTLKLDNLFLNKKYNTHMIMNSYLEDIFHNFKIIVQEDKQAAIAYFNSYTFTLSNKDVNTFLLKKCIEEENIPLVKDIIGVVLHRNIVHVFHPTVGMNSLYETDGRNYYHAATISVDDVEMFYMKSQNDFNKDYQMFNIRSTSVGDIVLIDKKYYMIKPVGIKQVEINKHFEILKYEVLAIR